MNESPKRGCSKLAIITVSVLVVIACVMAVAAYREVKQRMDLLRAGNNVRCICIATKAYAGDHDGIYPDEDASKPQTANQAYRVLFRRSLISDEIVKGNESDEEGFSFGCPNSPFIPDGDIGTAPDYTDALTAGECHWALTKGLRDDSDGNAPLIFENPNGHTWPLVWNCDAANQPVHGRAWRGGYIIVGRNDGSNMPERLSATQGTHVGLQTDANGKDVFTHWQAKGDFLDVER